MSISLVDFVKSVFNDVKLILMKYFIPIAIIFASIFYFVYMNNYNNNLYKKNITELISDTKFAGNGFFVNSNKYIVTTASLVNNLCKKTTTSENIFFALYKNKKYLLRKVTVNPVLNLALFQLSTDDYSDFKLKNFIYFEPEKDLIKYSVAYYYTNINKPYFSFLKKTNIITVYDNNFFMDKKSPALNSEGSPVLNDNLNLIGIAFNEMEGSKINSMRLNFIKMFLEQNNVRFYENKSIDLRLKKDYLNDITVQIVCNPHSNREVLKYKMRSNF